MKYNEFLINTLQKEPHFLIGGATGSGKSVLLNNIILNITSFYGINEADLYLIDLKKVELSLYKKLPHCKGYADTSEQAINLLKTISDLTALRYKKMEKQGLRKYSGSEVFVIVDEVADLMLTNKKVIEPLLQHIAQIGRAANIHLILATQIVRADILTTKITSNISGRFALRCMTPTDSRLLIFSPDAVSLPKYGKTLLRTVDGLTLCDVPLVTEQTIKDHVQSWKAYNQKRPLHERFLTLLTGV